MPMKALGVDVGLHVLDLVLLDDDRRVVVVESHVRHDDFRSIVRELDPNIVAIDSPANWASPGGRETEKATRKLGLNLYATPTHDRRSPKGFHDWMEKGMNAFLAISDTYPLYDGHSFDRSAIEIFPHASAVVLGGHLPDSDMKKEEWRRSVLHDAGVADSKLSSQDLIDAALGALTGLMALEGGCCWFGSPGEGVIVLPCSEADLPARYLRSGSKLATSFRGRCRSCGRDNPKGSRFCNQCGTRLEVK